MSLIINILFLICGFIVGFLFECFLKSVEDDSIDPFPIIDDETKSKID